MDAPAAPARPDPGEVRARFARGFRRAWFASDMHLGGDDPAAVSRAVALVEAARADRAEGLFLLGDIFRAWCGPRSLAEQGLKPFLEALAGASAAGLAVALLHGNHDFLLGPHAERELGVLVTPDRLSVALGGQRAELLHGDALCTRDRDYLRLHRVLRGPVVRALATSMPAAAQRRIADRLLSASRRGTSSKPDEVMAIVDGEARARLAAGSDLLVCGHVHRARDVRFPEGRLVVLADFETTGSHARLADGRLQLVPRDERFAPPPGPVVTIDGPAGSGKSSVARGLARRLGWARLDSGGLYRAITLKALRAGVEPDDPLLDELARTTLLEVEADGRVTLDGVTVPEAELRSPAVSALVSPVSARPGVREALLEVQRCARRRFPGLVAEGRDMATVVFPDAALRFYVDARLEVRARRRLGQDRGEGASLEQVAAAIAERDARDRGRPVAPLRCPPGAIVVDTSDLTLDEVVGRLVVHVLGAFPAELAGGSCPDGPVGATGH